MPVNRFVVQSVKAEVHAEGTGCTKIGRMEHTGGDGRVVVHAWQGGTLLAKAHSAHITFAMSTSGYFLARAAHTPTPNWAHMASTKGRLSGFNLLYMRRSAALCASADTPVNWSGPTSRVGACAVPAPVADAGVGAGAYCNDHSNDMTSKIQQKG
jgi:hypothetical protein